MNTFTTLVAGGAIAFVAVLAAVEAGAQSYSVFPGSSYRSLKDWEVQDLSCQDLWVARNEIYDRNGYCFKTARGRAFFSNAGCVGNVRLSKVENRNVRKIKKWERHNGCR